MRYLEVRRHTMRVKPSKHVCKAGVVLARRVGNSMGPFDRVVTSDVARAFESAIAFGFAVDEQLSELAEYDQDINEEVDRDADFNALARAVRKGGAAARLAHRQTRLWQSIAASVPDNGRTLVVSHGGIIELGAIGCLPDADHASWGAALDYCEGVRLNFDGQEFVAIEMLRNV